MVKKLFGEKARPVTQPTGFGTLPGFAQDAFKESVSRGTELTQDPSLFAPAPLTGEQQQAMGALSAGIDPTSASEFATGLETFFNPFEENVVQNAIGDILKQGEGLRSDIGTSASAAGGFGGTRQALLESELMNNILGSIGGVSARTRAGGFESAANRVLGDISRGQTVAGNLFNVGEVGRGINTATQQAPITANNYLAQLAQGLPTGGGTTTFSPETKGFLGSGGGVDPAVVAAAAAAASDIRLKDNIKYYDTKNSYKRYTYQYKGDKKKYIGVMAQDIKDKIPEAVHEIFGYFMVDYNKLGFKMELVND